MSDASKPDRDASSAPEQTGDAARDAGRSHKSTGRAGGVFSVAMSKVGRGIWLVIMWLSKALLSWVARQLQLICVYYWRRRGALWRHFTEYARDLKPLRARGREIRISTEDELLNAQWDGESWEVRLPSCCIVCGQATERDAMSEHFQVEGLTVPFWAPVVGLLIGLIFLLYSKWLLPVALIAGFVLGYRRHRITEVQVQMSRCEKHADNRVYPQLRTFADQLIVRTGSKQVKQQFQSERRARSPDENSAETAVPQKDPFAVDLPAPALDPIPLADEVHDTVDREQPRGLDSETQESNRPII